MKVGTLYLSIGHIVPSTLIVSEKNECLGTTGVDYDTTPWHYRFEHMSEKGMKVIH